MLYLQTCCQFLQEADAAQEALLDMTNQAGLQCGLVAGFLCSDSEAASRSANSLLAKAVLAQCDSEKVLLGCQQGFNAYFQATTACCLGNRYAV